MGWSFTSLMAHELSSWLFDFSMTLQIPHDLSHYMDDSWTSTLHYIFQYRNFTIRKWCGTYWLMTCHDMTLMTWKFQVTLFWCFLCAFLEYGTCYSSSSSLWLEYKEYSMWYWYSFFYCSIVFLHLLARWSSSLPQLHRCLLAWDHSPFPSSSSCHDKIST